MRLTCSKRSVLALGTGVLLSMSAALAAQMTAPGAGVDSALTNPALQDSDIQEARRKLERGRAQLRAGAFDEAQVLFARAAEIAPANSSVASEAVEHSEFRLPVARAQRWLLMGHATRAQLVLNEALELNQAHPERVRQLEQMLANLSALDNSDAQPLGIDNDMVVKLVRGNLEGFRQRTGRYPITVEELNQLMPAGRPPLDAFEVFRFRGDGRGYLLVLRNRNDAAHVITLHNTGLLQ